jgi:hypothetical protein
VRALALIALLGSGCSFLLIDQPPAQPPADVYPKCDDGTGPVAADVLFVLLHTASFLGVAAEDDDDQGTTLAITGILGGLHLVSAITGHRWTSRCARMQADWAREHPPDPVRFRRMAPAPVPAPRTPGVGERGGACFPNRTCNAGLACTPEQRCAEGAVGLEGAACFPDGSCSGGLTCTSSICTRPPAAECVEDAHCPEGRACHGGYCVLPPASP